uniref:Uncharacterized protein n=1 Tax=Glossina brevipalpis TaxID=37001 RepID=A0A1A9WP88_9MUSC
MFPLRLQRLIILINRITLPMSGFKHECTKIPKSIASRSCCNYPQIFPYGSVKICIKRTSTKATLCYYDCVFNGLNICRKNKCNYLKAYDFINWIFPVHHPFTEIYRKAFRKCISKANQLGSNGLERFKSGVCNPLSEIVYLCVENEMLTQCPKDYWNSWNPHLFDKKNYNYNNNNNNDFTLQRYKYAFMNVCLSVGDNRVYNFSRNLKVH